MLRAQKAHNVQPARPLRDRMEIISLAGYTDEEKLQIAKRYLLRRQIDANGLKPDQVSVSDAALRLIVRGFRRIGQAISQTASQPMQSAARSRRTRTARSA